MVTTMIVMLIQEMHRGRQLDVLGYRRKEMIMYELE